ncbi:MAG: Eco57I restriction-modification methylase domain-containing protein, partial [Candidatus Poribacteria bacterium]|nr:Eco57I restriction-modification methylase domain-containing protein [Candidatus Poribacteria bacterium]
FDSGDSYYRAVLQNLFFATLNTEIDKRTFSKGGNSNHRNFSRYRYMKQMRAPNKLLEFFDKTPFINGGLFDCLDSFKATGEGGYRIDCFSDNQYHKLSIPNHLFFDVQHGLIPLLEHYKFTVEENTPVDQEVALDPELLDRAFENLLAAINPETGETARKMTGSYYTPRAIVDYMVEEALVAALSQKCQPTDDNSELWDERLRYLFDYAKMFDDAHEWFDNRETDAIVKTISELKILDPAVGSGAFPMGILHKLTLALRRLDPDNNRWEALQKELAGKRAAAAFNTQDQQERDAELTEISETFERYRDSDFGRKLYLIQNSIFGVDIQPIACQIAKLRFFISLAIEQEPDRDAKNFGIKPLPNLETRFVAADTLIGIDLSETRGLFQDDTVQQLLKEIDGIREKFFLANNRTQKRELEEQEENCRKQLEEELERQRIEWIGNRQREIDQKVNQLPTAELRDKLREKEQKTFETRKKAFDSEFENARKIVRWKPYDQNAKTDWFDPERMFGINDGVDVVIGNPPYVQLQKENGRLGKLYQNAGFETFARTGDIYCLFYEKANQLLKNNGHACLITSNKWMRAGYGKKLRDYFVTLTQPIQLLDMGPDVFDATVDTNILLFQKIVSDVPAAFVGVSLGADFDRHTGNIARYLINNGSTMEVPAKGEPWAILSSAELNLKRKIEDAGKPLKDWNINIYRGIVTGRNEAFIIDEFKREELIDQDPKSTEIIKPLLRGKDIKRYRAQWAGLYLIGTFPVLNLDINDYPAVKNYLIEFGKDRLEQSGKTLTNGTKSRKKSKNKWFETQDQIAYYAEFNNEKIVYPETTHSANFFYDKNQFYLDKTCFMITGSDLKILVGLLSSTLMTFAYKRYCSGTVLGVKGYQYNKHALEKLPVAKISASQQQSFITLVDQILDAKKADLNADTSSLENEIDQLVYELYNLTEDEIAIVEGNV